MFDDFIRFVQELYGTKELIPLHSPRFNGNEKKYLLETIDSTFVSSVGEFVNRFEQQVADYTGSSHAIAVVNGTVALQIALKLSGARYNTEVITQSFTFVATSNAIRHCGAVPVFVDVNRSTMGLSPKSLEEFLEGQCELRDDGTCWNRLSNRQVVSCLPVHTFGFPAQLNEIKKICDHYNIVMVEDAAESLGSFYGKKHTGVIGKLAALSFNGNKIITTGGGGMILTNDNKLAKQARHITTTAKKPHKWEFNHDEVAYNYRLPNLNAALGVAQMESLLEYIKNKREVAHQYQAWGARNNMNFIQEPANTKANYWLNVVIMQDKRYRDQILEATNNRNIMTRPAWVPMHKLSINQDCQCSDMRNTEWLYDRVVNVPSSVNL